MSAGSIAASPIESTSAQSQAGESAPNGTPSGRNVRGQFAPGNPGGPGRPPKVEYIEREIVAIMASALTAETWLEIVEAVVKKAKVGNMTAVQWLSKIFLSGKLNAAAAAAEVRAPAPVEMFELGKKQHREWADFMENKRRQAEQAGRPDPFSKPEQPAAAVSPQTVEATSATTPVSPSAPGPSLPVWPERTVAPADRVKGFRVTKGPRPASNGPNRSKRGA